LIALSINNWNQSRINNIEEQDYYCKFLDVIRQDYDMLIIEMTKAKERLQWIFSHLVDILLVFNHNTYNDSLADRWV